MATKVQDAIIAMANGVINYVDVRIDNANYVRTDIGKVKSVALVNGKYSHTVTIRNYDYSGVFSLGNNEFSANSVVYLLIPSGQYNQMFILGHIDDTLAHIKGGDINIGNGNFIVDSNGSMTAKSGYIGESPSGFNISSQGLINTDSETNGMVWLAGSMGLYMRGSRNHIQIQVNEGDLHNKLSIMEIMGSTVGSLALVNTQNNREISLVQQKRTSSSTISDVYIARFIMTKGDGTGGPAMQLSDYINNKSVWITTTTMTANDLSAYVLKLEASGQIKGGSFSTSGSLSANSASITNTLSAGSLTTSGSLSANSASITNGLSAKSASITNNVSAGSFSTSGSLSANSASITNGISAGSFNSLAIASNGRKITFPVVGGLIEAVDTQKLYIRSSGEADYGVQIAVVDSMWTFAPIANQYMRLGSPSYKWNQIYSNNATINTSDRNEKYDIETLNDKNTKDFIMALNPVSFKLKNGESGRTHHGLIAQDVEDTLYKLNISSMDFAGFCKDQKMKPIKKPQLDENGNEVLDNDGNVVMIDSQEPIENEYTYGLRYEEFIPSLIKMVQMLQTEVEELKNKIGE